MYILIITLDVNGLNAPTKGHGLDEQTKKKKKKKRPKYMPEIHFRPRNTHRLKVRGWKKIFHANRNEKKAGVSSHKIESNLK